MTNNEAKARVKIDRLLEKAGWRLLDSKKGKANVGLEGNIEIKKSSEYGKDFEKTVNGKADYLLYDAYNCVIAVLEAKSEKKDPLDGKEQAREYAKAQKAPFVILSNGIGHYLWKLKEGCNPESIPSLPTQKDLEYLKSKIEKPPKPLYEESVDKNYIAFTQYSGSLEEINNIDNLDKESRDQFLKKNQLKILRDYQLEAIRALQRDAKKGSRRFLFEMATGTGKTLVSSAVIKLFLKTRNAKRVLFLVDRLELQFQAQASFSKSLKNRFTTAIYNPKKENWKNAEIVISTVQRLFHTYADNFSPFYFDFIISDEAHRSISGGDSRAMFEYFQGYKLGLTATPKDYFKGINAEDIKNIKSFEKRSFLDTYKTFGCANREPTFRYNLEKGIKSKHLIKPSTIDARTKITTDLLDKEGYSIVHKNKDGIDEEEIFHGKDFERRFFNEQTNEAFCKHFIENALRDPFSNEIGKGLIFCVSQKHASKIQRILNKIASEKWPDKYTSNFAIQVTSNIRNAQEIAKNFANNYLNGSGNFLEDYETSKTRICVTVSMMTTGYDCPDILNIGFMKPIFSPISFVQMKGRGTRPYTFQHENEKKFKKEFKIFDYFAVCEYFEKDFNYDKKIPVNVSHDSSSEILTDQSFSEKVIANKADEVIYQKNVKIPNVEILLSEASKIITSDIDIAKPFEEGDEETAIKVLKKKHENKPELFLNLQAISKEKKLDRVINWREFLHKCFKGEFYRFQKKDEKLEEIFKREYMPLEKPTEKLFKQKTFFKLYAGEEKFREIIDQGHFGDLDATNIGCGFSQSDFEQIEDQCLKIIDYINLNIDTDEFKV